MCKEGAYSGTRFGVLVVKEYGREKICGKRDWKNSTIGGPATGAVKSAVTSNENDIILANAIAEESVQLLWTSSAISSKNLSVDPEVVVLWCHLPCVFVLL